MATTQEPTRRIWLIHPASVAPDLASTHVRTAARVGANRSPTARPASRCKGSYAPTPIANPTSVRIVAATSEKLPRPVGRSVAIAG